MFLLVTALALTLGDVELHFIEATNNGQAKAQLIDPDGVVVVHSATFQVFKNENRAQIGDVAITPTNPGYFFDFEPSVPGVIGDVYVIIMHVHYTEGGVQKTTHIEYADVIR
jgi:hypothetical protein